MSITERKFYFPGSEKHDARNVIITRGEDVSEGVLNDFFQLFQEDPDKYLDMYDGEREEWKSSYAQKWFHIVRHDKWNFSIELPRRA